MIKFTLYGNPKGKGRPKFFRRGNFVGTYTPVKTKAYEDSVIAQAIKYKPQEPLSGPLAIVIDFFIQIPKSMPKKIRLLAEGDTVYVIKKPDIDNAIKSILDPLNTIFWHDDSQIVDIRAVKRYSNNPRTEVAIGQIPEAARARCLADR